MIINDDIKDLEQLVKLYNFLMILFEDDQNIYKILLDYNRNKLAFEMTNNKNFTITKQVNCSKLEATEIMDLIRNNFIFNHDITLPQRGKISIKLPDTNFYSYVMCHNIKNTKFDLYVVVRSKDDEDRMEIAQQKALKKYNEKITYKKD